MSRVAYVNGHYRPLARAAVSIQDRGFQFADSIYEVWAVRGGRLFDAPEHMARLSRSLVELKIRPPMDERSLYAVLRETMRRNRVTEGIVYVQVSRGAASRDHGFPAANVQPTIVVTAKNLDRAVLEARAAKGVKVISTPETRWERRDIKSVNLLPNVLAKEAARAAGAFEAWFVDDGGFVTEGASSTAWIVDAEGRLRTRDLSHKLLHGVTRAVLIRIARERQIKVIEEPFTLSDAYAAREAFISAASNPAVPVIAINGRKIGAGAPGPVSKALRAAYLGGEAD
ncbi:D-amino-acid transaminase [Terricaulis sp.]|uniref:D-amino-acid transaminase n=1 Tax=Terricaulis sp. TaxID=2768686 RepID=UPI003783D0F1